MSSGAFMHSPGRAFVQSQLYARKTSINVLGWQRQWLVASTINPTAVTSGLAGWSQQSINPAFDACQLMSFASLPPAPEPINGQYPGWPHAGTVDFRRRQSDPTDYYPPWVENEFEGFDNADSGFDLNLANGYTEGAFVAPAYRHPTSLMLRAGSLWYYNPALTDMRQASAAGQWPYSDANGNSDWYANQVLARRLRIRGSGGVGFIAQVDIIMLSGRKFPDTNSFFPPVFFEKPVYRQAVTLAPNTWFEIPMPNSPGYYGNVGRGWLGRFVFLTLGETPTEWEARTGLTLANKP